MTMPGRKYTQPNSSYRYGFNGKEKSDEIYGEGNAYDFGGRIQDPRLGRWFSVDPLARIYPSFSPYVFGANNPIYFIDPDGNSVEPVTLGVIKTGANSFKVYGEVNIKIQVLNMSSKANSDLYLNDYKNRVRSTFSNAINGEGTLITNTDVDAHVGGKGKGSNYLVKTGRVRETTWTYDIKVNVSIEVVNKMEDLSPTAHVIAIVNSFDPSIRDDIEGKPLLSVGGSAGRHTGFVNVDEIAKFGGEKTAAHELGHLFSLSHFWNKKPGDKNQSNLMEYFQWQNTSITPEQRGEMFQGGMRLGPEELMNMFSKEGRKTSTASDTKRINNFNVKDEIEADKQKAGAH